MFGQHSAESAVCRGGVRSVSSSCGFLVALGSSSCRIHGSSYVLLAISIVLEDSSEEAELLSQGVLVTESFCSVYEGGED